LVAAPAVPWLFGLYFLAMLGSNIQGPFVPLLIEAVYDGNELPVAIGEAFLALGVLSAISAPVLGRLATRWGRQRVLSASLAGGAVAAGAQAAANTFRQVVALRAATGAAQGGTTPLLVSMIAAATPAERRASVLNIILFPAYFAWLLSGVGGAAMARASVRGVFLVGAAALGVAGVGSVAARSRLEPPASEPEE
jgi:MFS family permease